MKNYREKDKNIAAFLLLCKDISFEGTEASGDTLYFTFTPLEKATRQVELYMAKQAEPVQPKECAESHQTILDLIWRWRKSRDGGSNYEKFYR